MKYDHLLIPVPDVDLATESVPPTEPVPPDVVLYTHYLTGSLDEASAALVEQRLESDAEFRELVLPIKEAWESWPSAADLAAAEPPEAAEAGWERLREKLIRLQEADAPLEFPSDYVQSSRTLRRWQLAAVTLLAVGVAGAGYVGVVLWPERSAPAVTMEVAPAADNKLVRLSTGSTITLQAGSRLTWSRDASAGGLRELYLDGSADLALAAEPNELRVIVTPSTRIEVPAAVLLVESPDPSTTIVTVRQGRVRVTTRGTTKYHGLDLAEGEKGLFMWGRQPRRVE